VNAVAIETRDAAPIHHALHKVIALHPVFVGGAVGEIKKILRFAKRVVFQQALTSTRTRGRAP
jgi:hypothetical protein